MSTKASSRLRNALVVVLALAALYATYRYTVHRMVEAKLDEIRKQGYPVTLAELDKWYPQPPPGGNAADIYLEASAHYVKDPADEKLPIVGNALTPSRSTPVSEEMHREIRQYLERNQPALDLLHKAASMKSCRYPSDMRDAATMFNSLMKCFSLTRSGSRMLSLESLSASANGDAQRAAESIEASIALAESVKNPPRLISYFVENACLAVCIDNLQQALSRTAFTEHQLTNLTEAFHKAETDDVFTRAIVGERARANYAWQEMRAARVSAKDLIVYKDKADDLDLAIAEIYRHLGLVDLDYLARLEFYEEFLRASDTPFPQRFEKVNSLNYEHALFNVLPVAKAEADITEKPVKHEARLQAWLRATGVSISVERYRVANSVLPDSLDALVPKFLTAVPLDPFDGQPLRYKKLAKGYIVYSVGEDGKDDGGDEKKDITFTVER